jgi:Ca2+/Na+ antiporter
VFIFSLVYIASFFYYLKGLRLNEPQRIVMFYIMGMSIYTIGLSTTMQFLSADVVNVIKYFKEIAVGTCFGYLFIKEYKNIKLNTLDWLVIAMFTYCASYIILPVGNFTFIEKIIVFKSYGLFGPLYFIGRWMPIQKIDAKKITHWVIGLLVIACIFQLGEVFFYKHLQSISGFTAYNQKINQLYSSGSYGLTLTFETDLGTKRFASFFHDPLDFAITLLLGICIMIGLIHFHEDETISKKWKWAALILFLFALYETHSRASIVGTVLTILYFIFMMNKKQFVKYFLLTICLLALYLSFNQNEKIKNYIIDTVFFRESSSLSHLLAWLNGIEAIIEQPYGLGLGSSGIYAFGDGLGIGGENYLIFMGVQTGILSLLLYLTIFIYIWVYLSKNWKQLSGYLKIISLALLLFKAGSFLPMFTSYFESFLFISYFTWFLSGYLTSQIEWRKNTE